MEKKILYLTALARVLQFYMTSPGPAFASVKLYYTAFELSHVILNVQPSHDPIKDA